MRERESGVRGEVASNKIKKHGKKQRLENERKRARKRKVSEQEESNK